MVLGLSGLLTCHWVYAAEQNKATPISFDQFIDQTTGDEVAQKDLKAQTAYRGKRVYKSIFRWINLGGYYFGFTKRFQQWCRDNNGRYAKYADLTAACFDQKWIDDRILGSYDIQIVTTATSAGEMTAGYATFYFFRQQEIEALRKSKETAETAEIARQVAELNRQKAVYEQAKRFLPITRKTGQKICRTIEGQSVRLLNGKSIQPQYFLTAFTEGSTSEKIQLRVVSIKEKWPRVDDTTPASVSNVDRLLLDGNVMLQLNTITWDAPLLWQPCD